MMMMTVTFVLLARIDAVHSSHDSRDTLLHAWLPREDPQADREADCGHLVRSEEQFWPWPDGLS
jgi:hypothetical protein